MGVIWIVLGMALFWCGVVWLHGALTRLQARQARARLLAGSEDDLRRTFLACDLFDLTLPRGRMRDDGEVARLIRLIEHRKYSRAAWEFEKPLALESFLVDAERRLGGTGRPSSMDHGYLQDLVQALARRFPDG